MFNEISFHKRLKLKGHIAGEKSPKAWVVFAHGSGSSRFSERNNWVAGELNKEGYATFLFDLLTSEEDLNYENRFDIELLGERLVDAVEWLVHSEFYHGEPIALYGASTGAAAALTAARKIQHCPIYTVISRGGRPDLAGKEILTQLHVPVLLIVGSLDDVVIELNETARNELSNCQMVLVSGATHLFEEPGTLQEVVNHTLGWLKKQLKSFGESEWKVRERSFRTGSMPGGSSPSP